MKLRGQRIELGEIEGVLGHQAVVLKDPAKERLVAFVVGAAGEEEDGKALEGRLRAECQRRLPEFMVPSRIVALPTMPLNAARLVILCSRLVCLFSEISGGIGLFTMRPVCVSFRTI